MHKVKTLFTESRMLYCKILKFSEKRSNYIFFTEKIWLSVKCSENHIPFCIPFSLRIWLLFTAVSLHISVNYSFFQWNHWQKLVQFSVTNTVRRVFFTEIMRIYYWHNQLYFSCFHSNCSIFHSKNEYFSVKNTEFIIFLTLETWEFFSEITVSVSEMQCFSVKNSTSFIF